MIDEAVEDEAFDDPTFGSFQNSILSGSLEFSGGFVATLDLSIGGILIGNDFAGIVDVIQAGGGNFNVQANTSDLSAFESDQLPIPGTILNSNDTAPSDFIQLVYGDDFGLVAYGVENASNVNFSATAVPEPTGILPLIASLVYLRRRRIA